MDPSEKRPVAVMSMVCPALPVADVGFKVMEVRVGAVALTVMAAVRDTPFRLAVMVAVPAATPVTTPPAFTVATDGAELVQVR